MWMASWRSSKWDPPLNWIKRWGEVWRHLKLLSGSVCSLVDFWKLAVQWIYFSDVPSIPMKVSLHSDLFFWTCCPVLRWCPMSPVTCSSCLWWCWSVYESQSSLGSLKEDKGISNKRCVSKCPFVILLIFTVHLGVDQSVTQFGIRFIHEVKNKRRKL